MTVSYRCWRLSKYNHHLFLLNNKMQEPRAKPLCADRQLRLEIRLSIFDLRHECTRKTTPFFLRLRNSTTTDDMLCR